ncbi:MAG: MMPL family transporter [Proteobacteria bacterium]|nr:MMPL family transporter [Pseudomonadota bacterium]MCP4918566.1 MMPL family transporter [Pseudomonadota bacterium]
MYRRFAVLILDNRKAAGALLLAIVLAVASGAIHLQVDFSAKAFFGTASPELDLLDEHLERFPSQEGLLLILVDGGGEPILTRERLDALDGMADTLRAHDKVTAVRSIADMSRVNRNVPGMGAPLPLRASVPRDEARAEVWRAELLADPALVPRMISADGSVTAMLVDLSVDADDIAEVRGAVLELEDVVDEHDGDQGLVYQIGGIPAVRAGLLDVIIRDQVTFVTISVIMIAILLFILFRSVHGVNIPLLAAAVPASMTFGLMGFTDEPVGLINNAYATLLPVIAVADAIHMITRFHEERRKLAAPGEKLTWEQRRKAVIEAMGSIGAACFLTTFTTAIGFLSLNLASMQILKSFGLYAAAGIGFAYFSILLIVPLALSMVDSPVDHADGDNWLDRMLQWCASFSTLRPKLTLGITAAIAAVFVAFGTQVEVDNWLTGILPPDHEITVANGLIDEDLGGIVSIEYDLTGADLRDPVVLQAMKDGQDAALELAEVRSVDSPATLVVGASTMMGGPAAVPEDPAFVRRLFEQAEDVSHQVLTEDRARIVVRTKDVGANAFAELTDEVSSRVIPPLEAVGVEVQATGTAIVAYAGINRVTTDLRNSLTAAFLVIAMLITVLFRSIRTGLISLAPNALPLLTGYGTLGLMGWDLDPGPAVVFTVALGIAVDDTIHLLARFREEQEKAGYTEAIHNAVRHSGRAVFVTSLILTLGFGINSFSSFPSNRVFGAVGAVVIATAFLCDVFVLPALLQLARPPRPVSR